MRNIKGGIMIIKRIIFAFKMFWFAFCQNDLFAEKIFVSMATLFENALKVMIDDKPHTTHLMMGDKRIVSFWMYPGMAKNPVDRINELLNEIDALKEVTGSKSLNKNNTACTNRHHTLLLAAGEDNCDICGVRLSDAKE